jgi:hypothetical protein
MEHTPTSGDSEPLREADTLAWADLVDDQGREPGRPTVASTVRCGRPLVYPVPPDGFPDPVRQRMSAHRSRPFGALFAFDLGPPPDGYRYTAARFGVELADRRHVAIRLDPDGGAAGFVFGFGEPEPATATAAHTAAAAAVARSGWLGRLGTRTGQARAYTSGLFGSEFAWVYESDRGELVPAAYGLHAVVEVPAGVTDLRGALDVQVRAVRSGWGGQSRRDATLERRVEFAEALPHGATPTAPAVRLCVAADVVAYSRQPNDLAEQTQRRLVSVLAEARRNAGIDEATVQPQPQGDGQFTVLPVGIDESVVIPRLVDGLASALRKANRDRSPAARMRLRVALHRGLVKPADNGWIGTAAIAVHRILDSEPLRAAIDANPDADFALGVPDFLFRDIIAQSYESPRPDEFTECVAELPRKDFSEVVWVYIGR